MKHVRLLVLSEDLARAVLALAEVQCFHPDPRPPEDESLVADPGQRFREVYHLARARLDKIAQLIQFPPPSTLEPLHAVELDAIERLNVWLGQLWDEVSGYEEDFRRIADEERLIQDQRTALQDFAQLNIDLALLRARTRFLRIHVGLVPRENLRQLADALSLTDSLVHVYLERGEQAHVVIVGPNEPEDTSLDAVLNAAGFQALPIPEGLDRAPAELEREFTARLADLAEQRSRLNKTLHRWSEPLRPRLSEAERILTLAAPFVGLDDAVRSRGHIARLAGWVPTSALPELRQRLDVVLGGIYDLTLRDPAPQERSLVPTVPVKNRLLAPFAMLVRQYGIPAYGEIDPTPLFAASFLLMFGSMFGDLGQGAVIALTAFGLRRRLGRFWPFGLLAGFSSMGFGALYGSIFGYEELLPALWMSPLQDPLLMLTLALAWGVCFIVTACLIAIYNRLANGQGREALFGQHGVLNLVFYLALVAGAVQVAGGQGLGTFPSILALLSLGGLAGYAWHHQQQAPLGERVLVVAIETLETLISYVSNTLSFLRVAAFSLNHVALSIAVFTLADMMGTFGSVLTIILGNLFVLVLEGGIVMIQVMRLEYYEGFSRYFVGTGLAFRPIRLGGESS
ncbi:V-type ATP synthase subunit I [Caldichromatium japonicum]|nr:V-type ATPase 116kDa subunit family protein [Caldichromatium japonicum]